MRSQSGPAPDGRSTPTPKRAATPTAGSRRKQDGGKKLANGVVALSSAAIMAVYAAGYIHTTSAASVAPTATIASVANTPTAIAAAATATGAPTSTATAAPATTAATTAAPATASAPVATATVGATATPPPPTAAATSAYRDGTYTGSGTSRHGGVTVAVTIKNGTITSVRITASNTRYPIARIAALPGEVVAAQSASIDFVSGATDSSMAFRAAVARALAQAQGA